MSKKTILKSIRGSNKYNFSFEELLDEEIERHEDYEEILNDIYENE